MKKVFLCELITLEPVIIASKKGKTRFVETTNYLPASSIVGAVARRAVLENVANSVGNCKYIESVNQSPECQGCEVNCLYRKIWIERDFKITNAVYGEWNLSSPGVSKLQTVCKPRTGRGESKDQLLFLFLEREFWSGKVKSMKIEEIRSIGYKKSAVSFDGKSFNEPKLTQFTRVAIDEKFRTSKEGMLYGFTAIEDGQKFRFALFCDESIAKAFDKEIRIGAWKSRGMGLVKINVVEKIDADRFVEQRAKEIRNGFDEISKLLDGLPGYYGTYTYLTDGTKKPELEVLFQSEKTRKFVRFEKERNESYFVVRNTIQAGSAGVFYVRNPEEESKRLAEMELKILNAPWFDWIFFNHPVHYEKSVLKEVSSCE